MLVTNNDQIIYKVNVTQPWPCPLDFYQCPAGVTVGFWFYWDSITLHETNKRFIISMGKVFRFSKSSKDITFIMRSYSITGTWFVTTKLRPGKWNLLMWMINDTHHVHYVNGFKQKTKTKGQNPQNIDPKATNEWEINENFDAGNFYLGPILVWSGRKSPVLMWRLFQQGLPNYDEN